MVFEIFGLELREILLFIIPFFIVFLIAFGIFERMKIFNRRINIFLALSFSTLFATTSLFAFFSNFITQLSALFAIAAFLSLFVIGITTQMYKRSKIIEIKPALEELRKRYNKVLEDMEEARRKGQEIKFRELMEEKERLEKEIKAKEAMIQ